MVGIPTSLLLPALVAFVAVALGTVSLVLIVEWIGEQTRKRRMVGEIRSIANEGFEKVGTGGQIFRSAILESPWLKPIASRMPALQDAELLMQQAQVSWSLPTLILMSVGTAVALGLGFLMLTRSLLVAFPVAIIGAALPTLYVRHKKNRRLEQFEELLPEAIDLVGRALRAGHPLSSGFKMAADDGPEPVASEFRRVFEEQRFGLPLQDSLLGMADRVNIVDTRILVTAILIQREVGGNLAEILDNLSAVIRARFTIRRQIRVYTAQGRMTGYLLALLPFMLFALLYMINPEYMSVLFTDPIGKILVGVALVMQLAGFFWIRKIVNIEI
ncbi:MAG TPA: type II secretion system F family protein [Gemmatimonadales bacterium]|jgi:tight adherence protein B|nr:type II secretion system F family protein [Gemmatimonadales bacterium]